MSAWAITAEQQGVGRRMNRVTGRNILVLVGAYYLSLVIGMPFFIVFAKISEKHVYTQSVFNPPTKWDDGNEGFFLAALVNTIPLIVDAILAAVMAGWLVESGTPRRWAWSLAALLFLFGLGGHHRFQPPTTTERAMDVIEAVIPAIVSVPIFIAVRMRLQRRSNAV